MKPVAWHVYVLKCGDGTLYTGATNDLKRRIGAHAEGKGAKYTRGRGPILLAWKRRVKDRGAALRLEAAIKRMSRSEKERFVRAPAGSSSRRGALRGRLVT